MASGKKNFVSKKIPLRSHSIVYLLVISHRNVAYKNLPLEALNEKFLCSARTVLNQLECQNLKKKRIVIDTNEMIGKFIADSTLSTVLGLQTNHCDETHQIIKYIETDLMNFGESIKIFLTPIIPKRFLPKVLRKEVVEFFDKKVSREIARRRLFGETNNTDVLQAFIDAAPSTSIEFITAQIFTFFAGR